LTQAQADTCCAATSNRGDSPVPVAGSAVAHAAALPAVAAATVPVPRCALQDRGVLDPLPVPPVARHLLLSVLLV
jgi:hypothetical protein